MKLKFRVWDKARKRWLEETETSLHAFTNYHLNFDGTIQAVEGAISEPTNVQYVKDLHYLNFEKGGKPKVTREDNRFVIQIAINFQDKNKKEIYEGDILKLEWNDGLNSVKYGYVKYWFTGFRIFVYPITTMLHNGEQVEFPPAWDMDFSRATIIGNILETPDVLKDIIAKGEWGQWLKS